MKAADCETVKQFWIFVHAELSAKVNVLVLFSSLVSVAQVGEYLEECRVAVILAWFLHETFLVLETATWSPHRQECRESNCGCKNARCRLPYLAPF